MAGRVYSTRFLLGAARDAPSAATLTYTVPANRVAVVRTIDWWIFAPGNTFVGFPGLGLFFASSLGAPANGVASWRGDQVLTAGEVLGVTWVSGNMSVMVSGFLLTTSP